MKLRGKFASALLSALWVVVLMLSFALPGAARGHWSELNGGAELAQVTHHVTGFYDDRSLDVGITVERVCTWYMRYKIQVQLPSGAKQFLAVMAPPGGLQPEVRDANGDGIRNDLVLTPAMTAWPPTVLINDGHDHFVVSDPGAEGSLTSHEDVRWSTADIHRVPALTSCASRTSGLMEGGGLFLPKLKGCNLIPSTQAVPGRLGHRPSSERAPPTLATKG